MTTPIRSGLKASSSLLALVSSGLGALEPAHVNDYFQGNIRTAFSDSLDLDKALQQAHPQANRWDYLLGHTESRKIIGMEPHSAKSDQISTVIAKRKAALDHLRDHLRPNAQVAEWLWVASGRVQFADTEKARFTLDQHGIRFVGRKVMKKHLPRAGTKPGRKSRRG